MSLWQNAELEMGIKRLFQKRFPTTYVVARQKWALWRRRLFERRMRSIQLRIIERYGLKVIRGPFAGMTLITRALKMDRTPMLIGCYESELHAALCSIGKIPYRNIIDVGCAEGYYAVGLARLFPGAHVYAFDIDPGAREFCNEMVRVNEVASRVSIGGICDVAWLNHVNHGRTLLFCDCEGCELNLLYPDIVPSMKRFDLLVELHDNLRPGITPELTARFSHTHSIEIITASDRDPNSYPEISFLSVEDRRLAVAEFRNGVQRWAMMFSKITA